MKTKSFSQFPFWRFRALIGLVLSIELSAAAPALAQMPRQNSGIQAGQSYHHDVSPALRDMSLVQLSLESESQVRDGEGAIATTRGAWAPRRKMAKG